jgi:hypothetical protein
MALLAVSCKRLRKNAAEALERVLEPARTPFPCASQHDLLNLDHDRFKMNRS